MAMQRHFTSWRHAWKRPTQNMLIDWVTPRSKPGLLTSNVPSLSQADPIGAGHHSHSTLDITAVAGTGTGHYGRGRWVLWENRAFKLNSSGGDKVRSLHRHWDLGRMTGSTWGQWAG